jgi:hypothetical protein
MLAQVVLELPATTPIHSPASVCIEMWKQRKHSYMLHDGLRWDILSWSSSQYSVMWRMDLQMKFNGSNNLPLLQVMAASPSR